MPVTGSKIRIASGCGQVTGGTARSTGNGKLIGYVGIGKSDIRNNMHAYGFHQSNG